MTIGKAKEQVSLRSKNPKAIIKSWLKDLLLQQQEWQRKIALLELKAEYLKGVITAYRPWGREREQKNFIRD